MTTVALSTTPATLDPGTAYELDVVNSGSTIAHVQIAGGLIFDQRINPGQTIRVHTNGQAVTAYARSGSGQVTTTAYTNPETAGGSGAYAPGGKYWPCGMNATARLRAELADASRSTGITFVGDSTTYTPATTRFPAVLASALAAAFPAYAVQTVAWNPTNLDFDAATVVSGTPTNRGTVLIGNGALQHYGDGSTLTSDIDLRVRVKFTTWSPGPGGNYALVSHQGSVGSANGFIFECRSNGNLSLQYGTSSTVLSSLYQSSTAAPVTAGTPIWLRATLNVGTGVITFYTSTDGTTWTQLGTGTGPGSATTLADPGVSVPFDVGAWNGTNDQLNNATVYSVEIRNGIGGARVTPVYLDRWSYKPTSGTQALATVGSPVLTVVMAGAPGQNMTYMNTNIGKMISPAYASDAVFLNDSHNEANLTGRPWLTLLDTWLAAARGKYANDIGVIRQNPRLSPAAYIDSHASRMSGLFGWAVKNNLTVIDVYRAFKDDSRGLAALLDSDGIHPSDAAGSPLWGAVVQAGITPAGG